MSFDPSEVGKIKLKVYLTSDGVKSVLDAGSGKILMNDATIRAFCEGKNLEIVRYFRSINILGFKVRLSPHSLRFYSATFPVLANIRKLSSC